MFSTNQQIKSNFSLHLPYNLKVCYELAGPQLCDRASKHCV